MLAVSVTLSVKHLGIAIASICGLILVIIARKEIGGCAVGLLENVVGNVLDRWEFMVVELLVCGILFGALLAYGAVLGPAAAIAGVILGVVLFLTVVLPN